MPRRPEVSFPLPDAADKRLAASHIINESIDKKTYSHFVFEFCTFEKLGAKDAKFFHCEFRHCEFVDCYLAHAIFDHCTFTGSYFDRCVFSWAKFPNSGLDYTSFMNCGPVLSQVIDQKPRDPQSAARFLRNLASEHKKVGNWEQVDRFIIAAYHERERHFWYAAIGQNDHYRTHYSIGQRLVYMLRYLAYRLSGVVFGYGVSWTIFARTIAVLVLAIFPMLNYTFSYAQKIDWTSATGEQIRKYFASLYVATLKAFFPFIGASPGEDAQFLLPFWLSGIEAIIGTVMFTVFAALLFRWASKGN